MPSVEYHVANGEKKEKKLNKIKPSPAFPLSTLSATDS